MINKKGWPKRVAMGALIVALIGGAALFLKFYKEDFNKNLPTTVTFANRDIKPEDAAYRFWYDLIKPYQQTDTAPWAKLIDARFNKFQLLAGDSQEFAVDATFWVKPEYSMWSVFRNWGVQQKDGTIQDIHWTMRIKSTGKNKYTLTKIEETTNAVAGLAPVKEHYQKEAGVLVRDENNRYTIENEKLKVTYDNGKNWQNVPIKGDALFAGDYSGSKDTLIPGSFVITPAKTAFIIVKKVQHTEQVNIVFSNDKGKTWKQSIVPGTNPGVRFRKIGFTSQKNGYLIITCDRTMSFEAHSVFKTADGGKTWKEAATVHGVNSLVTDAGFINDQLGFISFGSKNEMDKQSQPFLFRTDDGGKTWSEVVVPIPPEYQGIFTVAEIPVFDGSQGTLLVNQGPTGDFQGGKVLARFISIDKGVTWHFANLADPDQVLTSEENAK